jgi:pilus assembly protein Flp/PilA
MRFLAKLLRDTKAATAVEYALIVSLIVLAIIGGVNAVAGRTTSMWDNVSASVEEVMG